MKQLAALACARYQLRTRHFLPADVGDGEWGDWEVGKTQQKGVTLVGQSV